MGDEFYAIIKLVSGEEILSLIMVDENDGDPLIVLQNPIVIKLLSNNGETYVKVKPWIELTSESIFFIKLDKVITMTETTDEKIISIYENYINEDETEFNTNGNKIKLSKKMGYVSSVEEARKKLEEIYNDIKES
jgi:hypothetical protein